MRSAADLTFLDAARQTTTFRDLYSLFKERLDQGCIDQWSPETLREFMRIVQLRMDHRRDMVRLQSLYDDMASINFKGNYNWRLVFVSMVQHFCSRRFGFNLAMQSRRSFLELVSELDPEIEPAINGVAGYDPQTFSHYLTEEVCLLCTISVLRVSHEL